MTTGCNDDDSSFSCSSNNNTISYLILGDGDFSLSFDLARRILLESSVSSSSSSQSFHLTATGIDTLQEMEYKYKDSVFLLKNLISLNDKNASNNNNNNTDHHHHRLTVSIQHGVNAILPLQPSEEEESTDNDDEPLVKGHNEKDTTATTSSCHNHFRPEPADIVIFNHPHLGFEDANLHACFLAHLLDSVNRYWLKKKKRSISNNSNNNCSRHHHYSGGVGGIFYLTLALGQWERWKGNEAIARLGLFIINRLPFQAPLPVEGCGPAAHGNASMAAVIDTKPYFQLRRHQTGKSFANRRKENASETFALGRLAEKEFLLPRNSSVAGRPFWYNNSSSNSVQNVDPETKPTTITTTTTFSCPFCNRTFNEKRSVKNHIRSKHVNHELNNGISSSSSSSMMNIMNGVEHHNKDQQQQQQEWECPYCNNNSNNDTNTTATTNNDNHVSKRRRRFFCNEQALNDHITAKHLALHSHIPPDYKTTYAGGAAVAIEKVSEQQQQQQQQQQQTESSPVATETVPQQLVAGRCDICLQVFNNHHMDRFIPPPTTTTAMTGPVSSRLDDTALQQFACNFCAKTFREKRARLQHENFCTSRSTATAGPTII